MPNGKNVMKNVFKIHMFYGFVKSKWDLKRRGFSISPLWYDFILIKDAQHSEKIIKFKT